MKQTKLRPTHRRSREDASDIRVNRSGQYSRLSKAAAYRTAIGILALPAAFGMGYNSRVNSETPPLKLARPRSVNVLQSPPNANRVPKEVGRIINGAEIMCAHYAYEPFPIDGKPGFKATDYRVFSNAGNVAGFVLASDIRPARTVPPCNDTKEMRDRLEDSVPNIQHASAPVHGKVVK